MRDSTSLRILAPVLEGRLRIGKIIKIHYAKSVVERVVDGTRCSMLWTKENGEWTTGVKWRLVNR